MTEDKMERNVDNQPDADKPAKAGHQAPQNQAATPAAAPEHRVAPGRKPLFRT